ncbi:MAG TPA: DUF2254 domain-containing protein [Bacillales bacterium]
MKNHSVRLYKNISKREFWDSINSNLWFTPLLYVLFAVVLAAVTLYIDIKLKLGYEASPFFSINYELTNSIVSTVTAGILTLMTFTFNSILVVFTTFSGQFSPRVLKNFIANKGTQRVLGIFNGSFFCVLGCFLYQNSEDVAHYIAVPYTAAFLTALCAGTFVFFINHAVGWLQVNNMTSAMKKESVDIIKNSLETELEPYRVLNPAIVQEQIREDQGYSIMASKSGYLQLVGFTQLIEEARKDDILIKLEYKVGDYVYESTPLLTYWTNESDIDEKKYQNLLRIGERQTEVQDLEFSLNKFVEVALRALGDNDPKTASNTIYQIGDLLVYISNIAKFTPYLVDEEKKLRLIIQNMDFNDYLYTGFANIRHYGRDNVVITVELLNTLRLMAKAASRHHHDDIWEFALYIAHGFENYFLFELDQSRFYRALYDLAAVTGKKREYDKRINRKKNTFKANLNSPV